VVQRRAGKHGHASDHRSELDQFERVHEARGFDEWQENCSWTLAPASARVGVFLKSLKEYLLCETSMDFKVKTSD
jgi:hypothetical protein